MLTTCAHWPPAGVNEYCPDVVLLTVAGDQVPFIPFCDTVGSVVAASPEQIGPMVAKLGMICDATVTVNVADNAH